MPGEVVGVGGGERAPAPGRRRSVRYSRAVARRICTRIASGETLESVCADVAGGMPCATTVRNWMGRLPKFRDEMAAARAAAGWTTRHGTTGPGKYCEATAQAIFTRLCAGESLTSICADEAMPAIQTVDNWRDRFPEFDALMMQARRVQAERFCELGWEIAQAATPKDAHVAWVKLNQLRWMAGVMAPKRYGRVKPVEGEAPPPRPQVTRLIQKRFFVEEREDGARRVAAFTVDTNTNTVVRLPDKPWDPPPQNGWARPPSAYGFDPEKTFDRPLVLLRPEETGGSEGT